MAPQLTDWIQAAAALLTMAAAFAALMIAAKAPRLAAKFAEQYRSENAAREDLQRYRMSVFSTLMAHRSEMLARDARLAINSVDVAFADDLQVRNARRLFMEAAQANPTNAVQIVERYHAMIEAVARAMNAGNELTGFDVRTGYYPMAMARLDEAALAEAEEKIALREEKARAALLR